MERAGRSTPLRDRGASPRWAAAVAVVAAPALAVLAHVPAADAQGGRVIHSFVHDRARAHRHIAGHRILAAGGNESRVFRTPRGKGLDWTVPTPAIQAVHVRWRAVGASPSVRVTLDHDVNVPMPKLESASGGGVVTGNVAAGLDAGEHRVRVTASGAEVDWIALGPAAPPTWPVAPPALPGALPPLYDAAAEGLFIPASGSLVFHTIPPAGAQLRYEQRGGPIGATVSDGRKEAPLASGADLTAYAGVPIRLTFLAGTDATLIRPRLELPGAPAEPRPPPAPAQHVIVWLVDTLRPDHLPVYNKKTRVEAPAISRLSAEGVTFDACLAQGNESITSHASLFSGQYPVVHKLTTPSRRLAPDLITVQEAAKKAGVRTGGFISNGYVSDRWGFGDGWDAYQNFIRDSKPSHADVVWKRGRGFLEGARDGVRTFTYLGTIDPHVAYNAPKPYTFKYGGASYQGRLKPSGTGVFLDRWKANGMKPALSDEDKRFLVDLYDGEVSYNDHVLGQLLEWLDASGRAKDTAVVLLSDHGEEFFETGSVGHGHTVRQVLTHIPCLVRWPAGLPAGRRVAEDVELMDFYPTLLDLLGVPAPAHVQGESLVSRMVDGHPAMPRPAFTFHGGVRAAKLGPWKYLLLSNGERLHDVVKDPNEDVDLAVRAPLAARVMREVMATHVALNDRWRKPVHGHPTSPTAAGADLILGR